MPRRGTKDKEVDSSKNIVDRLWRFFSSTRLALVLILVLTGLGLIGALLLQAPGDVIRDKLVYQSWLEEVATPKYGAWTPLFSLLRLFDMFHSPWFLGAGILLVVNILICSLNRWQSLRQTMSGGPVRLGDTFYTSGNTRGELSTTFDSPQEAVNRVLSRRGYRIRAEQYQDRTYIAADKNRSLRLGTYVSHLSLILFIIAFLIGSYFGFRDTEFVVPEGVQKEVGHDTNLSLYLESFVDEYYDDGAPKDYRSQVKLYENGAEVKSGIIRVNHPMIYNGTRFYQTFFGPAVKMQIKDTGGKVLLNETAPMTQVIAGQGRRNAFSLELPDLVLTVRVIGRTINAPDPILNEDELAVQVSHGGQVIDMKKVVKGVPQKVADLEFTYLADAQYSGFQVSRDPGNFLIWLASSLFIIAVSVVLYFPHKQVWVMVQQTKAGSSRINIRTAAPRSLSATTEFERLMSEIKDELSQKSS